MATSRHIFFNSPVGLPLVLGRLMLLVTLLLLPIAALASDWKIYRGDQQMSGVSQERLIDNPQLLWTFKTEAPVESSAVIVDGIVYIGSNDTNLYALDLFSGEKKWAFETRGDIKAPPLYLDGSLYVGSLDDKLYKIKAATGEKEWEFKTGNKIHGSANWYDTGGEKGVIIIFGSYDSSLYGVYADTGEEAWSYVSDNYINGAPAIYKGEAVVGGCDGYIHLVDIITGEFYNEIEIDSYIAGTISIKDQKAYIGHYDNVFLAADLESLSVDWEYSDKADPFFSSAAIGETHLYFGGRDKQFHCVNRTTGEGVWTFPTGDSVDSSPVLCGNRVVFGSEDGRLYILDTQQGKEVWSFEIGESVFSSPAVSHGIIVVGANDGLIYAFGDSKSTKKHPARK